MTDDDTDRLIEEELQLLSDDIEDEEEDYSSNVKTLNMFSKYN